MAKVKTIEDIRYHTQMLSRRCADWFRGGETLHHGFSIDCVTVVFKKGLMLIWDFDEKTGKCKEGNFIIPETSREVVRRMAFHCGEEKINSRLKNTVEIL